MSSIRALYGNGRQEAGYESNLDIDYVLHYNIPSDEHAVAEATYIQLIDALTNVGLATEVRSCNESSLLIFVRIASGDFLCDRVYQARLQDWLHGVRAAVVPNTNLADAFQHEPVTEAERLRLVYLLITLPRNEGGAGITPKKGQWRFVHAVFPLHNYAFNKTWIQNWSTKYLLEQSDLDSIRNEFGENVAFYFAFMQSYFLFLVAPAALGIGAWLLLGQFSWLYALANCLWSVIFFEYWRKREVDLAVQWGVRGVSKIQHPRPEFAFDRETEDPVTGERVKVYSPLKRFRIQVLQIPFAAACIVVLGGLIVMCNSLEIFINEVYDGPFKMYLAFLPTIVLVVMIPAFSTILTKIAEALTHWENYKTLDGHRSAMVQKEFVLNFITSYMPLIFTAFVYLPFGDVIKPFLEFWYVAARAVTFGQHEIRAQEFQINANRIRDQMFYFTVTAQIVNFGTETILPYVKRQVLAKFREIKREAGSGNNTPASSKPGTPAVSLPPIADREEEAAFLNRVRKEVELEEYDVTVDYREMVIQFGYLSLFSVAWPLAATCFLINNWVELRSDALKIAISSRRPIPWRADSIGPWLNALGFLSWLGSISSAAIVYLCSGSANQIDLIPMQKTDNVVLDDISDGMPSAGPNSTPLAVASTDFHDIPGPGSNVRGWGLLLAIFFMEHIYLAARLIVRFFMQRMDSPGLQKERRERFSMKKRLLLRSGTANDNDIVAAAAAAAAHLSEKNVAELNERAGGTTSKMFWQRQQGRDETVDSGRRLIQHMVGTIEKRE